MDNDLGYANEGQRLAEIMGLLAGGDRAAAVMLYNEFGGRMAGGVRRRLRELGIHTPGEQLVADLVMDACFELSDCASGWKPGGGALPWTWARRRIDAMIAKSVGIFTDPLDESVSEWLVDSSASAGCADDLGAAALLDGLAGRDGRVGLLVAAFAAAHVSERDRAVTLEYRLQGELGDASPANTVGAEFGLKPDHVRQIVKRTRTRLARLADGDGRFRPLADLPLLGP